MLHGWWKMRCDDSQALSSFWRAKLSFLKPRCRNACQKGRWTQNRVVVENHKYVDFLLQKPRCINLQSLEKTRKLLLQCCVLCTSQRLTCSNNFSTCLRILQAIETESLPAVKWWVRPLKISNRLCITSYKHRVPELFVPASHFVRRHLNRKLKRTFSLK